jgi:oligoribonuclease NrnB/cAMP/cGMP phosphodiesterase (DHH superfamily)
MDEALIETSEMPLQRRSLVPGKGFFYPDEFDDERREERRREAVEGAEAVVVTDSDADGLGCIALVREMRDATLDVAPFEERLAERLADGPGATVEDDTDRDDEEAGPLDDVHATSAVGLVPAGPHSLYDSLEHVAEYLEDGADVYVCDLCPDNFGRMGESLEDIVARAGSVHWYDHHQWDDEVAEKVRGMGVDLVVGDSDEECSTDVALRSLDYEFPERFTELATVTRDHDLWLREDPRSDDLADYAYWSAPEEYATIVGVYGVDLPQPVLDYVEHRRIEKRQLIEKALSRAVEHRVGDWTVGVTYGRCSQNEVAEGLREQGCDAAVIVKPAGSASIRGTDEFERCHEVAAQVNGGGHPKAAGCKPDIYDDMLDMAQHWTTEGQAAKKVILRAFESLVDEQSN